MLKCLRLEREVHADPFALYGAAKDALQVEGPTALLETRDAELDARRTRAPSADSLRHVMMLRCALRCELHGPRVRIEASTDVGRTLLARLADSSDCVERDRDRLLLHVGGPETPALSEAERLKEASPLDVLRALIEAHPDTEQAPRLLAVFAHEMMGRFEPSLRLPDGPVPDCVAFVPELTLEMGRGRGTVTRLVRDDDLQAGRTDLKIWARLTESPPAAEDAPFEPAPPPFVDMDDEAFEDAVRHAKAHIHRGDAFQVVLSRTFTVPCLDPRAAYGRLRRRCPSPYGFLIEDLDQVLLGASPETAVRVGSDDVEVSPIAGTRPRPVDRIRGEVDPDLDARLEAELRLDEKEVAEHLMLVDLARNDVARVASGKPRVERLLSVARFSRVMHLVSEVHGTLREDLDALHALRACSNPGTLTGAPKIRATQISSSLEASPRGVYGGAVALFRGLRNMDSAIVIRSATVRDGVARVRAGAGVVADSDPAAEAEETLRKAANVLGALGVPHGGVS